mmetsp:Transcript_1224/g.1562  ORF Transcript_1224/g.1562 Transcript_1224/m.1562 type:complete len:116 (-) Transcript_1224:825-1172(-)
MPSFAATSSEISPSKTAEIKTARTTSTVAKVPTMDKYDNNRGVRSSAVGKARAAATAIIKGLLESDGNSEQRWSVIVTKNIQRHENSSKYRIDERMIFPHSPNASLAICGKEVMR